VTFAVVGSGDKCVYGYVVSAKVTLKCVGGFGVREFVWEERVFFRSYFEFVIAKGCTGEVLFDCERVSGKGAKN